MAGTKQHSAAAAWPRRCRQEMCLMKGMTPVEVTAMIKNVIETVAVVVSLVRGLFQRPPQKAPRRKNRRR